MKVIRNKVMKKCKIKIFKENYFQEEKILR